MRLTWLADDLRAAGVQVVEESGWLTRVANPNLSFDPIGVLWHHTAAVTSASNPKAGLAVVRDGRSDLTGPLAQAFVDYNGVFHVISANLCHHAGRSGGSGPIPVGDGNQMLVGWESGFGGTSSTPPITAAQYNASIKATAVVLRRLGHGADYVRGHKETSMTGKIDPYGLEMDQVRADVAAALGGQPPQPPAGTAFQTWASRVNVRSAPNTSSAVVGNLASPTTVYVQCQIAGETVTSNGYTNNLWSKISSPVAGYISNIFIDGPASLPVGTCSI